LPSASESLIGQQIQFTKQADFRASFACRGGAIGNGCGAATSSLREEVEEAY
jgi:hypothetical protein